MASQEVIQDIFEGLHQARERNIIAAISCSYATAAHHYHFAITFNPSLSREAIENLYHYMRSRYGILAIIREFSREHHPATEVLEISIHKDHIPKDIWDAYINAKVPPPRSMPFI